MLLSLRRRLAKVLPFLRPLLLPPKNVQVGGVLSAGGRLEALHLRHREVTASDSAVGREKAEVEKLQDNQVIGIRIADSQGTSLAADQLSNGSRVDYRIWGRSRQNEEGVEAVCGILVQRLNADGAKWPDPLPPPPDQPEQGVDCLSAEGNESLLIQVTRAEPSKAIWSHLSSVGEVGDTKQTGEAADILRTAIQRKAAKTPSPQRSRVTLALDATEAAGLALEPVVLAFHQHHGNWARSLGFSSIWVVGPNPRLTSRLDLATSG